MAPPAAHRTAATRTRPTAPSTRHPSPLGEKARGEPSSGRRPCCIENTPGAVRVKALILAQSRSWPRSWGQTYGGQRRRRRRRPGRRGARIGSQFEQAMRRCGTRSMPVFRSVVSVLVRFVVRSFSTNSRPAPAGGRLRRPSSAGSTMAIGSVYRSHRPDAPRSQGAGIGTPRANEGASSRRG
jgi:hypothetical protein